jgi:hypothetical protein
MRRLPSDRMAAAIAGVLLASCSSTAAPSSPDLATSPDARGCTAGALRCSGQQPQTCTGAGTWDDIGPACMGNTTCIVGACLPTCAPGSPGCSLAEAGVRDRTADLPRSDHPKTDQPKTDGKPDLSSPDHTKPCTSKLNYASQLTVSRGGTPTFDDIAILDIDGNGTLDLLVHLDEGSYSTAFHCFSNDGKAGFTAQPTWQPIGWSNQSAKHLERANLNNDKLDDLVGVWRSSGSTARQFVFLKNKGSAGVVDYVDFLSVVASFDLQGSGVLEYCHGDLDGDGKEEFVFASGSPQVLRVVEVDPAAGTVKDAPYKNLGQLPMGQNTFEFCDVVDLDGDGAVDLVVGMAGSAHAYRNTATGFVDQGQTAYPSPGGSGTAPYRPEILTAKQDWNGDGKKDLFWGGGIYMASGPFALSGGGQFWANYPDPDACAIFDDGCGTGLDFAAARSGSTPYFYSNTGTGGFGATPIGSSFYPRWLFHANLDGKGHDDLLGIEVNQTSVVISVYLNAN